MTPRQLSAYERLYHWDAEEDLARFANAIRAAHHSSDNDFKDFIKKLTK